MARLNSGGSGGGSSSSDAAEELTRRDRGSTESDDSDDFQLPDEVNEQLRGDSGGSSGGSSGSSSSSSGSGSGSSSGGGFQLPDEVNEQIRDGDFDGSADETSDETGGGSEPSAGGREADFTPEEKQLRDAVADETEFSRDEISSVRQTENAVEFQLSEEARLQRSSERFLRQRDTVRSFQRDLPGEAAGAVSVPLGRFSEEDLQFDLGDDGLEASPTREARRRAAEQDLERQLEDDLGRDLTVGEDFTVEETDDGFQAQLTEDARRDIAAEQIESRLEDETGVELERGEDFTIEEGEDGFSATLTPGFGDEDARIEQARQEGDFFSGAVERAESLTGVDIPGEGSIINQAEVEREFRQADGSEVSTIADAQVPFSERTVLEALDAGADTVDERIAPPVQDAAEGVATGPVGRAADPLNIVGEGERRRIARLGVEGGAALARIPSDVLRSGQRVSQASGDREKAAELARSGVLGGAQVTESAITDPVGTGAFLAGGAVGGSLGVRGAAGAGTRVRSARVRSQADDVVDLADITSERGVQGDLPLFETSQSAPTRQAVGEVRTRALDSPESVSGSVGTDRTLFHSTDADLGPQFTATRGQSELPGLFTSPDASPLRLSDASSSSGMSLRLPRRSDFSGGSDRFAAFPGDRIEGMPSSAAESRRIRDPEGGFMPDPEASGSRFLDESAEAGTAFVRPTGGRTTELESIFPPGSRFEQSGMLGVRLPSGRTIPLDTFRRADADDVATRPTGDTATGDVVSSAQLSRSLSRNRSPDGTPVSPPLTSAGSTGRGRLSDTDTAISSQDLETSSGTSFSSESSVLSRDSAVGSSTGGSGSSSGGSGITAPSAISGSDITGFGSSGSSTATSPAASGGSRSSVPGGQNSTPTRPFLTEDTDPGGQDRRRGRNDFEEEFEFGVASARSVIEGDTSFLEADSRL